ncbi:hypothetical protein SH449x_004790 [Pirellulaceae bacterium SH449]
MKRWQLALLVLMILAWPPIFSVFVSPLIQHPRDDGESMRISDFQMLLDANRWTFDVPKEQDGWMLRLEGRVDDKIFRSGGSSVRGGSQVTLVTRRNVDKKRIDYAFRSYRADGWTGGSGSIDDPLANGGVRVDRKDGPINIGDPIYRGGRTSVQAFPGTKRADFEVRVLLEPTNQEEE